MRLFWITTSIIGALSHGDDDFDLPPFWERVVKDPGCLHETDCGFPGISQDECHSKGCCWDTSKTTYWCSGVATQCKTRDDCSSHGDCNNGTCKCDADFTGHTCADVVIKKVHVIQSCHLDVGFTDLSAGVVNRYLTHHIPQAIQSAKDLREDKSIPAGWRLKFMAQSYYLGFYLDCPPNMGFQCPSEEQKQALRDAIKAGDITWHAFPHNAELENTSPVMLDEGLKATKALDDAFGLPSKRSLSQRDVPGVPRSVIPVLKKNGIDLLSVGVNGASMYPRVPKIFRWQDPISGEEVLAMWHPRGYGGYGTGDTVKIPSFNEAFVTDWIGDNQGPGNAQHYKKVFAAVQKNFPKADIVASTFDDWLDAVDGSGIRASLPIVKAEVGDSWIYGVPSDPKKTAQARALDRAVTRYLTNGGERDAAYKNFTRLAIKNCEHTWGKDVKSTVTDNANWDNKGFERARTLGPQKAQFGTLEESWWEQRKWGFEYPLQALPAGHGLATLAQQEIADINQPVPFNNMDIGALKAAGFSQLADPTKPVECGDLAISFDAETGAINHLVDSSIVPSVSWASESQTLLALGYRTYSQEDFQQFQNGYSNLTNPPGWFRKDFGKPNETISKHAIWRTKLASVWSKADDTSTTFYVTTRIADSTGDVTFAHQQYGAPEFMVTKLELPHVASKSAPRVSATIWCVNKTSTRLPETMFVSFMPSSSSDVSSSWEMQKLGQWQKTIDDVIAGGSKHLHGISIGSGFRFNRTTAESFAIEAVDAPVINLGEPLGFPTPCEKSDVDPWDKEPDVDNFGISSVFWNNLWGTNYVQWYPFNRDYEPVAGEENFISRYNLYFGQERATPKVIV